MIKQALDYDGNVSAHCKKICGAIWVNKKRKWIGTSSGPASTDTDADKALDKLCCYCYLCNINVFYIEGISMRLTKAFTWL